MFYKILLLFGCALAIMGMTKAQLDGDIATKHASHFRQRSVDRPAIAACADIEATLPPSVTPRNIIDGSLPIELGDYPYMVGIVTEDSGSLNYACAGTLIAKRFVLTVAHCLVQPTSKPVMVRMGVVNLTDTDQMRNAVEIRVKKIHVHPEYSGGSLYNDIGLLELETDVIYTANIYPACLYTEPQDPPANADLYTTSFGRIINRPTRERATHLTLKRNVIVPNHKCNESYAGFVQNRRSRGSIADTQLCAIESNVAPNECSGISGSPLILVVDKLMRKFRVVGITSAGFVCGGSVAPDIYTRVASFSDFIESIVWPIVTR